MTSLVFAALADPTRRRIMEMLTDGGAGTATALAAELSITRQAVAKHLRLLHEAGLTRSRRVGRETRFEPRPEALVEVSEWVASIENQWTARLAALALSLETGDGSPPD